MGDDAFVWGDFDCLDRQADPVVDGPSEPAASVECFAWPSEPAAAAAPVECFAWPSEPAASVECFAWPSEPATAADAGVADEAPAPDAPDAPEAHAVAGILIAEAAEAVEAADAVPEGRGEDNAKPRAPPSPPLVGLERRVIITWLQPEPSQSMTIEPVAQS